LAASHLQTPGAAPLGFGGYVGSSLVESTLSAEREVSLVRPSDIHLIFRSLIFCDAPSSEYLQGFEKVFVETPRWQWVS
jgi:hypothetical protein